MCGIAGIIHRDAAADIGTEMSRMLQSMKHRGPDSSGYALFGPATTGEIVIRFKLADANDPRGFDFSDRLERSRMEVESRLHKIGASIERVEGEPNTPIGPRSATTAISRPWPITWRTFRAARSFPWGIRWRS